ncbi:hypothetical protein [Vibrio parahaemolyticus]|uniref:hypothetical protein n=1 Tax=Vibrio parahaemolyticus TaxID=670 RepID=UPI0038D4CD22
MSSAFYQQIQQQIEEVKAEGLYKAERIITSQQQAAVKISTGEEVLNFCANNYLGLANIQRLSKQVKLAWMSTASACISTFYLWYSRHPQRARTKAF